MTESDQIEVSCYESYQATTNGGGSHTSSNRNVEVETGDQTCTVSFECESVPYNSGKSSNDDDGDEDRNDEERGAQSTQGIEDDLMLTIEPPVLPPAISRLDANLPLSLQTLNERNSLEDENGKTTTPTTTISSLPTPPSSSSPPSSKSFFSSCIDIFKYIYSMILLLFSLVLVLAAMFTRQTLGTSDGIPPFVACFIFCFLLFWLAMMEGGQGCLVGLKPIDRERYRTSHPRSYQNTVVAHKGTEDDNNMERLIVGRQFLVVLVVFVSNAVASAVPSMDTLLGLPDQVVSIFLGSGVALILVTVTIGQLTAQVNAAHCMLDFINNAFMLYFVTYISLAIEFSGLLHCVYLVPILLSKWTKTTTNNDAENNAINDEECPPCSSPNSTTSLEDLTTTTQRTALQRCFFWGRVTFSLSILILAFAVTLDALFAGQTTMWDGIPPVVSVIVFFVLMAFVGIMDGMQIALFAVINLLPTQEESIRERYSWAYKSCQLTFDKTRNNLQAFLIGRQICVTIGMFVVARVVTLDVEIDPHDTSDNIFGVSNGIQQFFNTGLLGAMITTIVASLLWRVVASSFPLAYLNNPIIYGIIRLCLIVEKSGICSAAWILARIHKKVAKLQPDQVYLEETNGTNGRNNHDDDSICGMKRRTLEPCPTATYSECDTVATPTTSMVETPTRK